MDSIPCSHKSFHTHKRIRYLVIIPVLYVCLRNVLCPGKHTIAVPLDTSSTPLSSPSCFVCIPRPSCLERGKGTPENPVHLSYSPRTFRPSHVTIQIVKMWRRERISW